MSLLSPRIIIVGGGLAGMAAGVALQSAGARVTLIEARKTLGGRAGSFEEPQSGDEIDNCQHVLLGCCVNLLDFYRRIGAIDRIHFERTIRFRDETGRAFGLTATPGLPAPLHLAPAFLRFGLLSVKDRILVAMAMAAMLRMGRAGRAALSDVSFGDWLDEHAQSESLIKRFYDPVVVSALNEETRRCSAACAIQVFQESLLANRAGYVMGVPATTLAALYERVPVADLRLGKRIASLVISGDKVSAVRLADGEEIPADAVIVATNHHALEKLIPPPWFESDTRLARLGELASVPILGAHLTFERPVMADPHAALIAGPLQWLFRKDGEGRVLHGVISAARDWVDRPRERMLSLFEAQVRKLFPAARAAKLERGVIVIEKRATFSPAPGVDHLRPGQSPARGGLSNLYLAGDYTQTGWPATMEGAVRSGYLAADAVRSRWMPMHNRPTFVVPDLETEWVARVGGLDGGDLGGDSVLVGAGSGGVRGQAGGDVSPCARAAGAGGGQHG